MAKKGLGKGFGSLLPDNFDQSILLDKQDRVQKVLISDIKPDPNQPRKDFDQIAIHELSKSIERYGILQPLVVTQDGSTYLIVAGERRYHAAQKAGLTHVPVLVRSIEELERLEIGLIENMQRVDLSPMEQAVSIARLNEQFSMSLEEVAERLGKAHTTVVNTVRLLQLPDFVTEALRKQQISEGHARSILALKDDEAAQRTLLNHIIKDGWSVRRAEAFVQSHKNKSPKQKPSKPHPLTDILAKKYGADIKITEKKIGGNVQLSFKTK